MPGVQRTARAHGYGQRKLGRGVLSSVDGASRQGSGAQEVSPVHPPPRWPVVHVFGACFETQAVHLWLGSLSSQMPTDLPGWLLETLVPGLAEGRGVYLPHQPSVPLLATPDSSS